ncbi:SecDF P1 head subdomain-containing protein [Geomesophilobacter sediminis]|uniref:Caspase family protein n=1 Tax=Geomesophilobacter sediminis TaxID=2798584 RepID=A0A8J7IP59_9BACT|nr:caspase family protein [Geomesophilobacter sediminis]MBJ6725253.1 caspase family protein [Geomesophilobacter sediminis]
MLRIGSSLRCCCLCLLFVLFLMTGPVSTVTAAQNGSVITLEVSSTGKGSLDKEITRQSVEVMKNRLESIGITDGVVEQKGARRITIGLERTGSEVDWIIDFLLRPSRLEFKKVKDASAQDDASDDTETIYESRLDGAGKVEQIPYLVEKKPLLSGDVVESAEVAFLPISEGNIPAINLVLNKKGAEIFAQATEASIGGRIAIAVDGNVISAPVIRTAITSGWVQVTGNFTTEEAQDLAKAIKSGILPAAIHVADRRETGAPQPVAAGAEANVDDLAGVPVQPRAENFAIVIGIEKYRDIKGVEFAAHDASTVQRYLTKLMGYPEENVVVLPNERATKSDLEKYLGVWLKNRVTPQSTVFVYYAGHGAPNPTSGEPYLVPYDGDPNYLETTAYPLKELYAGLSRLKAKQIVVVLDSCFSGSGGRSVLAKGARPLVMTTEAAPALKDNMVVLAAAGGSQISTSYEKGGHGLFTYYLLKGLKGEAGAGKEGTITVESLYRYLLPQVERAARLQNVEQTPVIMPPLSTLKEMGELRLR